MSRALAQQIADAVLYEGYLLYPYRASAIKNRLRWLFGVLYPEAYCRSGADTSFMQTECLVVGSGRTRVDWTVRFLQLVATEAVEREVACQLSFPNSVWERCDVPKQTLGTSVAATVSFSFPGANERTTGTVMCSAEPLASNLYKLCIRVANESSLEQEADRDQALSRSLISAHTNLGVVEGEFVSLLEPPDESAGFVGRCRNIGTWPVLVGDPLARNWMLSSPILLYEYPRVPAQSTGDLFDGTEIEELLTLRIRTMTDLEKSALLADHRARQMLERVEQMTPEQLSRLHGTMRSLGARCQTNLKPGDRVRLRPRAGADILDLALAGKAATVQKVETDLEGNLFLAVTVDDDPGRDFGWEGKAGHRFFFRPEELEPIAVTEGGS